MSYIKTNWVDQAGQVKYTKRDDGDYWILTPNYEDVSTIGTPVNADNMNKIENGIYTNDTNIAQLNDDLIALSNQCMKLSGNQTIDDVKTFNSAPKVPTSQTAGTALQLNSRGSNANGFWLKFGDGTLIQWGEATMEAGRNTMLVSMPVAYTNASSYRVLVADRSSSSGNVASQQVFDYTSSQTFKVCSSANHDWFTWFAIGR